MRRRLGTSLYAGLLFTVPRCDRVGHRPAVRLPEPRAVGVPARVRPTERARGRPPVGSHLIGGVAGLTAWWLIAPGASLTATAPAFSPAGFRLAASATVSLVATSWAMIATDAVHAPACATTLIVSLGLLDPDRSGDHRRERERSRRLSRRRHSGVQADRRRRTPSLSGKKADRRDQRSGRSDRAGPASRWRYRTRAPERS